MTEETVQQEEGLGLSLPQATSETCETEDFDKNKTYRRWCMTIFDEDGSRRNNLETLPDFVTYLAYGDELTKDGRKHYQCFAYTKKPVRWTQLKSWIPGYVTPMRGTFKDNEKYCSKQGQLKEFGDRPEQGKRNELLGGKRKIEESRGQSIYDIAEDEEYFPVMAKNSRFMQAYANNYHGKRLPNNEAVQVTFVHGVPGSGKTRWVREVEPNVYDVPADDGYKWKDGYTLQDAVLFDNLSPQTFSPARLLKELDRYKIQVPYKGGFTWWKPKRIYITSAFTASEIAESFAIPQEFLRRITVYKEL